VHGHPDTSQLLEGHCICLSTETVGNIVLIN